MKLQTYENGGRIRHAIRIPDFLLRIKGKIDARSDESVASSYVRKVNHRVAKFEGREVLLVSKLLFQPRVDGAIATNQVYNIRNFLATPDTTSNDISPNSIRQERLRSAARSQMSQEYRKRVDELIKVGEQITNLHAVCQERIFCAREHCSHKLGAYLEGVRTVIPDFYDDLIFDDEAFNLYINAHRETDENIFAAIEAVCESEEV